MEVDIFHIQMFQGWKEQTFYQISGLICTFASKSNILIPTDSFTPFPICKRENETQKDERRESRRGERESREWREANPNYQAGFVQTQITVYKIKHTEGSSTIILEKFLSKWQHLTTIFNMHFQLDTMGFPYKQNIKV